MDTENNNISPLETTEIPVQTIEQESIENNTEVPIEPIQPETIEVAQTEANTEVQKIAETPNSELQIQSQLQTIPTVDQNKEQFINNVQTMNQENKEEKKEGINFLFILILFVGILAAIYVLFPFLSQYI